MPRRAPRRPRRSWSSTTRRTTSSCWPTCSASRATRSPTAVNGEEALAKVAAEPPDLVLLDVMMPGLSGYDVCRRIRADPATALLPVVLVTSLDPQQERVKGIEAGADDFLAKPINQAELFARVRSLLRIKALQDEVRRQADALAEWNAKLEERVAEQVAQIERLGQLKRFFSPPVAEAIVVGRRAIDPRAAPARDLLRVRRPARLHRVHRPRRARGGGGGAARVPRGDGRAHRRARGHARPLRRRRHPDLLQRPGAGARRRRSARRAWRSRCRRASCRCARAGRKRGYELDLGIGIAQGYATLGAIGFEGRFDYAAIGSVVNLAARLCGEAKGGQILDRPARRARRSTTRARVEPLGALDAQGLRAAGAGVPAARRRIRCGVARSRPAVRPRLRAISLARRERAHFSTITVTRGRSRYAKAATTPSATMSRPSNTICRTTVAPGIGWTT